MMQRLTEMLRGNPITRMTDWCKAHVEFFAVKVSRVLAVAFIITGFCILVKTIANA